MQKFLIQKDTMKEELPKLIISDKEKNELVQIFIRKEQLVIQSAIEVIANAFKDHILNVIFDENGKDTIHGLINIYTSSSKEILAVIYESINRGSQFYAVLEKSEEI